MRRLGLALAALMLLAGCTGAVDESSVATTENATLDDVPAMPDDREGQFAAFNETKTLEEGVGGSMHDHDYWQGRDRVTLADTVTWFFPCCYTTKPAAVTPLVDVPPGALVYEGAGQVVVTISEPVRRFCGAFLYLYDAEGPVCTDRASAVPDPEGGPGGIHLWVRDGMAAEAEDMGEIAWGTPFVIPIDDPRQTDMPHATNTLWDFQFRGDDPALGTLRFQVKVEAVRHDARDIPEWPGHPDFYAEAPDRVVLVKPGAVTKENGPMVFVDPYGAPREFHAPEKLVSWGTRTVHVWANITNVKSDNPALEPSSWRLTFYNATGNLSVEQREEHDGAARDLHWTIPVTDEGMDNPYAPGSRWGFRVAALFEAGVLTCSGFCASYEITYDLVVHASAAAQPESADR